MSVNTGNRFQVPGSMTNDNGITPAPVVEHATWNLRLRQRIRAALKIVRRIVGVPDYDAYLKHLRTHHPETVPPTQEQFLEKCWEDKFSRPGNRCC